MHQIPSRIASGVSVILALAALKLAIATDGSIGTHPHKTAQIDYAIQARSVFKPRPVAGASRADGLSALGENQQMVRAKAVATPMDGTLTLVYEDDTLISEEWIYPYGRVPVHIFWDVSAAPAGAVITDLEYKFLIEDDGDGRFDCSDYMVFVNSEIAWGRFGGETDEDFDDDPEDDSDIDIDWRSTSAFNGRSPNRTWDFWVFDYSDHILGYETEGVLNYVRLRIHWEIPPASISIGNVSVTEGHFGTTLAEFKVSLSSSADSTVSVDWYTSDGTAVSSDYASSSGTMVFAPGETSKTVSVVVYGDTEEEPDEIFYVDLTNPINAPIDDGQGSCTILNDDGSIVLYDQFGSGSGSAAPTQDYEAVRDSYDCEAADDFVVTEGGWRIDTVELRNAYQYGSGPVEGMNIRFYQDDGGWPGSSVACSYSEIGPASDSAGNGTIGTMAVDLPSPCFLGPGRYWLMAQARLDYSVGGEFYWAQRTIKTGYEGVWRQPGDGEGWDCTSWTRLTDVVAQSIGPDLNFRLIGGTGVLTIFADDFESGDCAAWTKEVP